MTYIGTIELSETGGLYVNFNPVYKLDGSCLKRLTDADLERLLPGSVYKQLNLYFNFSSEAARAYVLSAFYDGMAVAVDLHPEDMIDNVDHDGNARYVAYKASLEALIDSGRLAEPDAAGLCRIVPAEELREENGNYELFEDVAEGERVYLDFGPALAGPYTVRHRAPVPGKVPEMFYVKADTIADGWADGVAADAGQRVDFEDGARLFYTGETGPVDLLSRDALIRAYNEGRPVLSETSVPEAVREQRRSVINAYIKEAEAAQKTSQQAISAACRIVRANRANYAVRETLADLTGAGVPETDELDASPFNAAQTLSYLTGRVRAARPDFSEADAINLFVCLAHSPFLILTGAPGSGRSALMATIAETLSAESPYVAIDGSVQSRQDFLGYYSPMTQTFEPANTRLFQLLKNPPQDELSVAQIDDFNAAPVGRYFADFLRLDRSRELDLGGTFTDVPKDFRAVLSAATDETYPVSKKLLDRAFAVAVPPYTGGGSTAPTRRVRAGAFNALFAATEPMSAAAEKLFERIVFDLNRAGCPVGYRSLSAARAAVMAAARYMDERLALDYAVSARLLTQTDSTEKNAGERLEELEKYIRAEKLTKSADLLDTIVRAGNENFQRYAFELTL